MIKISKAQKKDINKIAEIAAESFSVWSQGGKKAAAKWIICNYNAFPKMQYFVAKKGKNVAGYILWVEKGGFRKEAVWELEQIAVDKIFQGQGIGTLLIEKSLLEIKKYLKKRKSSLKLVEVTTGPHQHAQNLYKKALGAEQECLIKNLFRGDEIIMIARFNEQ